MVGRRTHRRIGAIAALGSASLALAACGGGGPVAAGRRIHDASSEKPSSIFAGPAGILSAAQPQPNGDMWLLAKAGGAETLQELDLSTGKITAIVPEGTSAASITESPSGVVAVGLNGGSTGAVDLRNGTSGALLGTVPVGAPVKAVAAGADGSTLYVLNGTSSSSSVTLVNLQTDQASISIPVPLGTTAIAVEPTGQYLLALTSSGTVDVVNVGNGSVGGRFPVGPDPVQVAVSGTGTTLFVLKREGTGTDIGVIRLATERQARALPAAAHSADIQVAANGRSIYDVVGTSTYGNVQVLPLAT